MSYNNLPVTNVTVTNVTVTNGTFVEKKVNTPY